MGCFRFGIVLSSAPVSDFQALFGQWHTRRYSSWSGACTPTDCDGIQELPVTPTREQKMMKRLEAIRNLPTLPVVIEKLNAAIRDPKSDGKRIARIIEDDPAIMARTLKVVNSAFYGGREPVMSLQMAVARLGMAALRNIALSTSVFSLFGKEEGQGWDRKEFWRHSICSGIAAAVMSESTATGIHQRYAKESLHLAGLLHDIGKIFCDEFFHEEFIAALRMAASKQTPLFVAEKAVLGMDHAHVGMWLGIKWKLGVNLTNMIFWHHDPDQAEKSLWDFVALVHAANHVCNTEKIGAGGDPAPVFLPAVWQRLGLPQNEIPGIVKKIHEEAEKSEIMLSLV